MNTTAFAAASVLGLSALRRLAVRDALAAAFTAGLARTFLAASLVAPLLGVTLLLFVLPLIPWFGQRPSELVAMFLFAVQHLGDLVAGILVVGQAGLVATWEIAQARERRRFVSLASAGVDPLDVLVFPRVWALAALHVFIVIYFKLLAVLVPVGLAYLLEGRFYGAEFGQALHAYGDGVLIGYAINLVLAFALGLVCCRPALAADDGEPPLAPAFRRALVLLFAAKLLYFVL